MPTATTLTSAQVRQQFIDFFVEKHSHTAVPSSPVVPYDDPTLMFTNAGMNQFKDVFLGTGKRDYTRAVDTQKCIRAGGKHNDLDDVGKDTYHHTFFEMLGNWSFGDYFKKEAIEWAWELLVTQWGLDPERLYATYFEGDESEGLEPDHEARDFWLQFLPADRVQPGNKKDNFWEMGDTGPCGPCSELHYDRSPDKSGGALVNADAQDTVVEIWNLVFIQFNRNQDGSLSTLPAKHVDTGMGFERIVRVLQGKDSNYDTDVFAPIFDTIQKVTGARAYIPGADEAELKDPINIAYRVIADHIRTLVFALSDGAHCGNEGRNYVLRSILRRAVRYGKQTLGVEEPFFYKLVPTVVKHFGDTFPEIKAKQGEVEKELREEEESFRRTLNRGIALFEGYAATAIAIRVSEKNFFVGPGGYKDDFGNAVPNAGVIVRKEDGTTLEIPLDADSQIQFMRANNIADAVIRGEGAFKLHDTYGFPIGLTQLMAEERGLTVDLDGFEREMEKAREISRGGGGASDAKASLVELVQQLDLTKTEFTGYGQTEAMGVLTSMDVFGMVGDRGAYKPVDQIEMGGACALVLGQTPFYAEAGGQVGDTGVIQIPGGARVNVIDTVKVGDTHFHLGKVVSGTLASSQQVTLALAVDAKRRGLTQNNHTITHVMNRALRDHVSAEAAQKGSLVDDEKTRFDFSHNAPLTAEQLEAVEKQVNDDIAADLPVYTGYAPQEDALKINGLRAVFGEKYPPTVRVVSIGAPVEDLLAQPDRADWAGLSIEFCGGTHLKKTGDAEGFVIVSEEGVAKGIRRITAITGSAAHKAQAAGEQLLARLSAAGGGQDADQLTAVVSEVSDAMASQVLPALAKASLRDGIKRVQDTVKKLNKAKQKASAGAAVETARKLAEELSGPVIVADLGDCDAAAIQAPMDVFRKKHPESAVLLIGAADGKVALMATVPEGLIEQGLKAGDWIKHVAPVVGGGGGGRPDSARAGGKDATKINEALDAARQFAVSKF
ncbi:MAG: alanine--tRNA ligase [Phycisphaerales bacterium JB063]